MRFEIIDKNFPLFGLIGSAFLGVSISYSNFYLFHFCLFLVITLQIYQFRENNYVLSLEIFNKYNQALVVLLFWYTFSLLWTPSLALGLKYIFYLLCGLSIVFSINHISKDLKNLKRIFNMLSILVLFEIVICLFESFSNFRMPISSYSGIAGYFGKDPVNFSSRSTTFFIENFSPPTGFRWNTNDLAVCMAIALPFFLCDKRALVKIFGILSVNTIVFMTASRAVFLSLILIYSVYLILIKKKIGTLLIVWTMSFAVFFGMMQLRESENLRINELANSLQAAALYLSGEIDLGGSLLWRRELAENGLNAFLKSYGLGLGAGGSVANQELIGPVAGRFTSMHNFWFEILVEGGIIISFLVLFLLIYIVKKLFILSKKTSNKALSYYSTSLFLSMIGFFPAAIAASSTIYFFPMWIMLGLSISVILYGEKSFKKHTSQK